MALEIHITSCYNETNVTNLFKSPWLPPQLGSPSGLPSSGALQLTTADFEEWKELNGCWRMIKVMEDHCLAWRNSHPCSLTRFPLAASAGIIVQKRHFTWSAATCHAGDLRVVTSCLLAPCLCWGSHCMIPSSNSSFKSIVVVAIGHVRTICQACDVWRTCQRGIK